MKKYFFVLAAVAMAFVGCNKPEIDTVEPEKEPVAKSNIVSLTANIPEFVSGTKATISDAGAFSWENGDQISVACVMAPGHSPAYDFVTFTYNKSKERFEADPATQEFTSVNPGGATYYPVSGQFDATKLSGLAKSFTMSGSVTAGETPSVTFTHQNAMLKVPFENVPSFADHIEVWVNDSKSITIYPDDTTFPTSFTASIPMIVSGTLTFKLLDNNDNVIIEKHKNSVSLESGKYYTTPKISVSGTVFVFNDDNKVDEARFFKTDGINTPDWTQFQNIRLNVLKDGSTKWCILPTSNDWSKKGQPVCLQVFKNNTHVSTTEAIWLYRDFSFDTTASSLKTAYRIYVYMSDAQWTPWQTQGDGTTVVKFTTWDGISTPTTDAVMERNADDNGYIVYHEFSSSDYGKSPVKYRFYNEYNAGWESKDETGITLNRDIWGNNL